MNRREFLVRVGGTLIAVPVILQAISCNDDSSGPSPNPDPNFKATSQSANSHTHDITVFCTSLISTTTVSYTSSSSGGHTHSFDLTATQLGTINGGGQVTLTSSTDGSPAHSHGWIISKPAGFC